MPELNFKGLELALETKQVADNVAEFSGYASTSDLDLQRDIIEPGAFGSINPKTVAMLRDHNPNWVIGGWTAFEQNGAGLKVSGRIGLSPHIAKGAETWELISNGWISGLSVGYTILNRTKDVVYDETKAARRIKSAKLCECSIVAIPANPNARIGNVKSMLRPELTEWLEALGFDEDERTIILTRGFDALAARGKSAESERRRALFPPPDPTDVVAASLMAAMNDLKGSSFNVRR